MEKDFKVTLDMWEEMLLEVSSIRGIIDQLTDIAEKTADVIGKQGRRIQEIENYLD